VSTQFDISKHNFCLKEAEYFRNNAGNAQEWS